MAILYYYGWEKLADEYTIQSVPIFQDKPDVIKEYLREFEKFKRLGRLPRLHIGHHVDKENRPGVGYLDNFFIDGEILYSDLKVKEETFQDMLEGAYHALSAEIVVKRGERERITSVALLSSQEPYHNTFPTFRLSPNGRAYEMESEMDEKEKKDEKEVAPVPDEKKEEFSQATASDSVSAPPPEVAPASSEEGGKVDALAQGEKQEVSVLQEIRDDMRAMKEGFLSMAEMMKTMISAKPGEPHRMEPRLYQATAAPKSEITRKCYQIWDEAAKQTDKKSQSFQKMWPDRGQFAKHVEEVSKYDGKYVERFTS